MLKPNNLSKISFKDLYIEQKKLSDFKSKTKEDWDKKAINFNDYKRHEQYINEFLSFVDFKDCSSLLDFACGAGLLAKACMDKIPNITLCDYSSKMLEYAALNCPNANIINASFEDLGKLESADLVFASRCLGVSDLSSTLKDLLNLTNKRLYFTYKIDSTFLNEEIINALDLEIEPTPNFIYAANILNELGYFFTINKINTPNNTVYKTFDDFLAQVEFSYQKLNDIQIEKLKNLYDSKSNIQASFYSWALFCVEK